MCRWPPSRHAPYALLGPSDGHCRLFPRRPPVSPPRAPAGHYHPAPGTPPTPPRRGTRTPPARRRPATTTVGGPSRTRRTPPHCPAPRGYPESRPGHPGRDVCRRANGKVPSAPAGWSAATPVGKRTAWCEWTQASMTNGAGVSELHWCRTAGRPRRRPDNNSAPLGGRLIPPRQDPPQRHTPLRESLLHHSWPLANRGILEPRSQMHSQQPGLALNCSGARQ